MVASFRLCIAALCLLLSHLCSADAQLRQQLSSQIAHISKIDQEISSEIMIDGVIDGDEWLQATSFSLDNETSPDENIPALVATTALLMEDGETLFVAFIAQDPNPDKIRAFLYDRDSAWNDDLVGINLDTFNDQRRAFEFFVNPLGVQHDVIEDDVNNNDDSSWDAIWDSAGRVNDHGYVVEMAIPLSTMRFVADNDELQWGLELVRFYPRTNRHRLSTITDDRNNDCHLCQFQKVTGFRGAKSSGDLDVTPTFSSNYSRFRLDPASESLSDPEFNADAGVDVSWGFSPESRLSLTVNPDFSQVETDAPQSNVNRQFSLFFPEKRPFFLEGAESFTSVFDRLVHTRTVVNPNVGVRLVGKRGANDYAVFIVDDTQTNLVIPSSQTSRLASIDSDSVSTALRYQRNIGKKSTIGTLFTGRSGDDYSSYMFGVDGRIYVTDNDKISFQYLRSDAKYPSSLVELFPEQEGRLNDLAWRLEYLHDERNYWVRARIDNVGDGFRADLGFFRRADFTRNDVTVGRRWYPKSERLVNRVEFSGRWDQQNNQQGEQLQQDFRSRLRLTGAYNSELFMVAGIRESLWDSVTYNGWFGFLRFNLTPRNGLELSIRANLGDQVDFSNGGQGDRLRLEPQLRWNLGQRFRVELRYISETLSKPEGQVFDASIADIRMSYAFTLKSRLRLIVQHNRVQRNQALYLNPVDANSQDLGSQLLYSYKVNPRTVVFVGYSDSYIDNDQLSGLRPIDQSIFMKIGYAWQPKF